LGKGESGREERREWRGERGEERVGEERVGEREMLKQREISFE
jgi:hypothetical protein